jgi:hypothetical protein
LAEAATELNGWELISPQQAFQAGLLVALAFSQKGQVQAQLSSYRALVRDFSVGNASRLLVSFGFSKTIFGRDGIRGILEGPAADKFLETLRLLAPEKARYPSLSYVNRQMIDFLERTVGKSLQEKLVDLADGGLPVLSQSCHLAVRLCQTGPAGLPERVGLMEELFKVTQSPRSLSWSLFLSLVQPLFKLSSGVSDSFEQRLLLAESLSAFLHFIVHQPGMAVIQLSPPPVELPSLLSDAPDDSMSSSFLELVPAKRVLDPTALHRLVQEKQELQKALESLKQCLNIEAWQKATSKHDALQLENICSSVALFDRVSALWAPLFCDIRRFVVGGFSIDEPEDFSDFIVISGFKTLLWAKALQIRQPDLYKQLFPVDALSRIRESLETLDRSEQLQDLLNKTDLNEKKEPKPSVRARREKAPENLPSGSGQTRNPLKPLEPSEYDGEVKDSSDILAYLDAIDEYDPSRGKSFARPERKTGPKGQAAAGGLGSNMANAVASADTPVSLATEGSLHGNPVQVNAAVVRALGTAVLEQQAKMANFTEIFRQPPTVCLPFLTLSGPLSPIGHRFQTCS